MRTCILLMRAPVSEEDAERLLALRKGFDRGVPLLI